MAKPKLTTFVKADNPIMPIQKAAVDLVTTYVANHGDLEWGHLAAPGPAMAESARSIHFHDDGKGRLTLTDNDTGKALLRLDLSGWLTKGSGWLRKD